MGKHLIGYKKFDLFGLDVLKDSKNLLGFSTQVDSTCLFYLLLANNINFDIAIVDYSLRKNSKKEVKRAEFLAKKYNKNIFIIKAPKFNSNFESRAREFRKDFFIKIINTYQYKNLILANQLNDRLEWFLMQFTKGCGLNSLLGFNFISKYDNFNIIRPLYNTNRTNILRFLKKNKIKYFIDKSNEDERFLRNYFRKKYSNKLIKNFEKGILKSFNFLKNDYEFIYKENIINLAENNIFAFKKDLDLINLNNIDLCSKRLGYVISTKQRDEILKSKYSCMIGSKIIIDCNENYIFITKDSIKLKHTKKIRNTLRLNKIPPKIRPFMDLDVLEKVFSKLNHC